MNHLTVAQNIFIGREPRRAFGLLLDEDKLNREAAALFEQLNLDHRSAHRRRRPDRRQAADGRDRQGAVVQLARADHGRADRRAQRRRDRRTVRHHPRAEGARRRHRLHLAQDGRAEADRRPRHRDARRRVRRHRADARRPASTTIICDDGRAARSPTQRDREPQTPRGEIALEVEDLNRGALVQGRQLHRRRAKSSASPG